MRAKVLLVTGFASLCAGWAQAAAVPPPSPYFTVTLTAWADDEAFTATSNSNYSPSEEDGYSQNKLCPPKDWECICNDPHAVLNGGGDPIDFTGSYQFSANADGDVTLDFENFGPNIETFLITTTITKAQEGEVFTCSSNLFLFCGFKDPPGANGETLDILFTDPVNPGGIPSAVPEPAQYAMLLIAFAGVFVAHRIRSRARRPQSLGTKLG
jgi:hypothetical protein